MGVEGWGSEHINQARTYTVWGGGGGGGWSLG